MFERNCRYSVVGVEPEHPGLLVGLDHVDVEGVAPYILLGHRKVRDNSRLYLVNKTQSLVWDEPVRVKVGYNHWIERGSSPVHTQPGHLGHYQDVVIADARRVQLDHLSSNVLKHKR